MTDLDYVQDTIIDHTALDVEWIRQPELMRRYADHVAEMKKAMDEAKERLDVGKARIERDVRADPSKHGIGKVTESAIASTILLQEEWLKLSQEYREARYEYDIAQAAVRAIDQRKTALENLVRLLVASYFAGPQTPRDLSQEWLKDRARRESNANVRMTHRRRSR